MKRKVFHSSHASLICYRLYDCCCHLPAFEGIDTINRAVYKILSELLPYVGESIHVRECEDLREAYLYATTPHMFEGDAEQAFKRVQEQVCLTGVNANFPRST